jgi:hypothetical protein
MTLVSSSDQGMLNIVLFFSEFLKVGQNCDPEQTLKVAGKLSQLNHPLTGHVAVM